LTPARSVASKGDLDDQRAGDHPPRDCRGRVVQGEVTRAERLRELFADPDDERRGWVAAYLDAVVGMAISGPSHDPDASERTGARLQRAGAKILRGGWLAS